MELYINDKYEVKDKKKNIVLSICIPTLGGSDRLEMGLKKILSYKGEDIEVIISDNDNTGKVQMILDQFQDSRLRYYTNECNYGNFYNWIKVLTYGRGKYLLTLNDYDWIVNENLPEILNFLKNEDASVIISYPKRNGKITYTEGARNGYSCTGEETHPSCFMLKKEKFCLIENVISIKDKVESYVQCTLALICSRNDKVCINTKIKVIDMPNENYFISHISRSNKEIKRTRGGFYYTPDGALKMLKSYIQICQDYYSVKQLNRLIPYLYKAQLKRATVEYKRNSVNKVMNLRYGLPYKEDINISEERKKFYFKTKEMLKGKCKNKILFMIWWFTLLDKYKTNRELILDRIEETIHWCLTKYRWAKIIQKCWRRIRYRRIRFDSKESR